ncbi:MAG: leucine-rich repeat domain-containing protein, partial [Planctomycetes bacterium]|nr:leucine-rich repeat domain-containing protein [Planctomycetota bacterium]
RVVAAEREGVAAIEILGGKVWLSDELGDRVWKVDLNGGGVVGPRIIDADLIHVRGFGELEDLDLFAQSKLTDAGLKNLTGLTHLKRLDLSYNNKITDAGLEHLKGLKNLQSLDIQYTDVTDAGVKKLQRALPKCKIVQISPGVGIF